MLEIWQDVQNYQGLYQISNLGRIRNKNNKIMHTKPRKDGYVSILLFKDGKYKAHYVHILVAKAFIPNPLDKSEVNHIDANKSNNCVANLEWVTKSENHWHAVNMELKPICPTIGKFGKEHPSSKPVCQYSLDGEFIKMWDSRSDAARFYKCNPNSISNVVNGHIKSCKGFIWKNA